MELDKERYRLVEWDDDEDDQENIKLSSTPRKAAITALMTVSGMLVTSNSSVWAIMSTDLQHHFNINEPTANSGISLFVWSLALAPLVVSPLSETYGRRPVFLISFFGFLAFQFAVAFGSNIETMLVGRFLCGLFGSSFLSIAPSAVADVLLPHQLGLFLNIQLLGIFMGPTLGPLIGGFSLLQGLRWPFYIFLMWSGTLFAMIMLFFPETYPPLLKVKKAKRLRKETGDESYRAQYEIEHTDMAAALQESMRRPIYLFLFEPILTLLCIYCGFLLSVIYFFFVAFPRIFASIYGFNSQEIGLSFISSCVGMIIWWFTTPYWETRQTSEPESRLPQMCVASVLVPIGLFMFAWVIYPSIHWIVPMIASAIFSAGCYGTFTTIISYTVQAYSQYSASAVAANTFVRCIMAGSFPMFGTYMLYGMGNEHWALTFIAFIGLLLAPSSWVLYKYGKTLRRREGRG